MTAHAGRGAARTSADSRHRAREVALQMLYQWEVGRAPVGDLSEAFFAGPTGATALSDAHREFALSLARGVVQSVEAVDPLIRGAADNWRLERMNVLDRLVLRLAVYEFLHEPETPAKVIINEALELARTFSGEDAVGFINGVLDAIRRERERV